MLIPGEEVDFRKMFRNFLDAPYLQRVFDKAIKDIREDQARARIEQAHINNLYKQD